MIPQTGQHVKCILRNGAVAEGIVKEWTDKTVELKSVDGESILIIVHPNEDIMLIKIVLPMPEIALPTIDIVDDHTEVVNSRGVQIVEGELQQKFQEAQKLPSDDPTRIPTLAKLRNMMIEQDKKIITEKVRNHYASSPYDLSRRGKLVYNYPNFTKQVKK